MQPPLDKIPCRAEPPAWSKAGNRVTYISAVFCLIVVAILLVNHFQSKASDPLENRQLAALKSELVKNPKNLSLKNDIRSLDLQLRKSHFRSLAIEQYGVWLLIGGVVVFLVSYKGSVAGKKQKPQKRSEADYKKEHYQTRWAVTLFGLAIGGAALALAFSSTPRLTSMHNPDPASVPVQPENPTRAETPAPVTSNASVASASSASYPSAQEWAQNWPRFRGPFGSGISAFANMPIMWDAKSGSNILWKAEMPLAGPASPVLWNDRIFLVGANESKREVYCFDTSGKLLWQKPVDPKRAPAEPPTVMEDTGGYAPSTPCTDGQRVYAIYANGDLAAFDFSGNQVWAKNLGRPENTYGHASSLAMYQNKLLIQFDQGGAAKEKKSKILALDSATGQLVWETEPRPVPNSWATPIVVNAGGRDLLVASGNPYVMGYDPAIGKELWRAKALNGEVLPSPIYSDGFVYSAVEGEKLSAIPANAAGDVTTNIAWSAEDGMPDIVSPLCDGKRVYLVNSSGTLTCYNAKDGKKLFEKELEHTFKGSTSLAGERLYLIAEDGIGFVIQAGDEFKELARSDLGEEVLSSPAFANGRFYIRAKGHLFCIGEN